MWINISAGNSICDTHNTCVPADVHTHTVLEVFEVAQPHPGANGPHALNDVQLQMLDSYPDFTLDHGIVQLPGRACRPGQLATYRIGWAGPCRAERIPPGAVAGDAVLGGMFVCVRAGGQVGGLRSLAHMYLRDCRRACFGGFGELSGMMASNMPSPGYIRCSTRERSGPGPPPAPSRCSAGTARPGPTPTTRTRPRSAGRAPPGCTHCPAPPTARRARWGRTTPNQSPPLPNSPPLQVQGKGLGSSAGKKTQHSVCKWLGKSIV